jgi:nickel/cobalt transporter (NicO) family protein
MRPTRGHLSVGVVLICLAAALPALSHPLGNFSIDHYSRFRVTSQDLRLRYVIDMAEIPTFQELLDIDVDRDRQITADERQAYFDRTVKAIAARLTATVNGAPLTWEVIYRNLKTPSVVAPSSAGTGPLTLRMLLDLRAEFPAPLSSANVVRYADGNYPGRTGWKEIVVEGSVDARVLRSSALRKDLSNELTRYPSEVSAPPQDVNAEFAFAVGTGPGWAETFLAVLRDNPSVWLMAILAALSLLVAWQATRKAGGHTDRAK